VGGTVENEGDSTNILERTLRRELFEEGEPFTKSQDEVGAVYWMTTDEILNHF
jgi:8-oxo-dGTP diphosphatase